MSRHQRANSDLQGFKAMKVLKNKTKRELESVGLLNRTFEKCEAKSAKVSKLNNSPQTPAKKLEAQELILDTYRLLQHFYKEKNSDFYNLSRAYLKGGWEKQKKQFNEHLNKLPYIEQSMHKKMYSEIEEQILSEWRKNSVLYSIRAFWYESTSPIKFASIGDFMREYNTFRDFIGQLAYLYFKSFFFILERNGNETILDELTERTAHFIITSTNTWGKLFEKRILPLLKNKLASVLSSFQSYNLSTFDLSSLQINPLAINSASVNNQLPKTTSSIDKFMLESKLFEKIQHLIMIRENLEQEIHAHQQQLIKANKLDSFKVLDKDDFISSLIYCMVKGKLVIQHLGIALKYFHYLLGPELTQILSKFGCDSKLADMESVFDFLQQDAEKAGKSLDQIAILIQK